MREGYEKACRCIRDFEQHLRDEVPPIVGIPIDINARKDGNILIMSQRGVILKRTKDAIIDAITQIVKKDCHYADAGSKSMMLVYWEKRGTPRGKETGDGQGHEVPR